MILLGLTGTPASGKSTVAKFLQEKGADWINADLIARDVLNRDETTKQLAEHFGDQILDSQGKIDRKALATLVFGESSEKVAALEFLESVLHPPTRVEITRRLKEAASGGAKVAILDVPLLFESKWDLSCDTIWCIDAPRAVRLSWAKQRGWDAKELDKREMNQLAIAEKRRLSNLFLPNETTLSDLHNLLDCHWANLVTMEVSNYDSSHHCFTD